MHRPFVRLALALALSACGSSAPEAPTPPPTSAAPSPATPPATTEAATRPRIVVALVYDQLGTWVLDAHRARLDPSGAIRRTIDRGVYAHHVVYDYAGTYTAPGHAAIYTGAAPWQSGIPSNRIWDRERSLRLSALDDGTHGLLGRGSVHASPSRLAAESVADVLERESGGTAVTVSLAMKDRSAVLPGGQHPDACFWLDPRAGGFTTSTYYASELPAWVSAWQAEHPLAATMHVWEPEDAASLASLGPDDVAGEGAYGWGTTFPHDPSAPGSIGEPDAYLSTPASTEHLLAFAREAVRRLHVGEDDRPDLLAISIATTDYIGHAFGPESWEYVDGLIRVDRAVGAFLDELEREHGPIAVLVTADHGIAPLVERARMRGHEQAIRWTSEHELELLRAHLVATLGPGEWVDGWVQPYVYLAPGPELDRARAEASAYLRARPGVDRVLDTRDAAALRASGDPVDALVGRSIPSPAPGDLYVVPSEWSVAEEELESASGTSHGSPWIYDREVPVLFSGPGVAHALHDEPGLAQARTATTIAHLLGVSAPALADPSPLPGAP